MVLAQLAAADHLWIGLKSRQFLPPQRLTNIRASITAEILGIRPELRIANVAAQTRIVSVARIRLDPENLCDLSKR
jgi:hypothetical protein